MDISASTVDIQISIIVPTLNEEAHLPILLDSLKAQTFRDFEVIVADANSTDRTRQIAQEYGARVVPGGMPAVGRNSGAREARGEFLFFFDADVRLPPDFLERALAEFDERFIDLATCEFLPDSDLKLDWILFRLANLMVKAYQSLSPRAADFCIFITRRLFRRVGGFDESLKLAEDHDLVQRASEFRSLEVLNNTKLHVSVRRLEKEGRFALVQKYMQVEAHLFFKGAIHEDIVDYDFASFDEQKDRTRLLERIESTIIELDRKLEQSRRARKEKQGGDEFVEKWKGGFRSMMTALAELAKPK
jgi:glycosyltransferase involved in cell wall biosynthesis